MDTVTALAQRYNDTPEEELFLALHLLLDRAILRTVELEEQAKHLLHWLQ